MGGKVIEVFGRGLCWTQSAEVVLCDFLVSNAVLALRGMAEYLLGLLCCALGEVEGDGVAPWWWRSRPWGWLGRDVGVLQRYWAGHWCIHNVVAREVCVS